MFVHPISGRESRGRLTHLPVSLAVTPVADVGHGVRAAFEHTKSLPHAVCHFSFVGAAIRPRVHAVVHGDVLHKLPLGQTSPESERDRTQGETPTPAGGLRCLLDDWELFPSLFHGNGGVAAPTPVSTHLLPSLHTPSSLPSPPLGGSPSRLKQPEAVCRQSSKRQTGDTERCWFLILASGTCAS